MNNELQFDNKVFRKYYYDLGIINRYSSLAYPQSNGQVEVMKKTIVYELKTRLEGAKGNWAEELSNVLWAYLTTSKLST